MGKGKKTEDDGLPEGFAEAVAGMSTDEIRQKMANIMLTDMAMRDVMEADDKYQSAKEAFEQLAHPYKEDFKSFKLQLKCCKRILDDKNGGAISARLEEEHVAAKEAKRTAGLREPSTKDDTTVSVSIGGKEVVAPVSMDKFHKAIDKIINPTPGAKLTGHKPIGSNEIEPIK